jgi:predicted phosphohydrolase
MEDKLWIEDVVESTPTFPFLSNSRINMVGFVHLHKVVTKRNAFSALSSV